MQQRTVQVGRALTELTEIAPDRPIITAEGRTLTRAGLEARANRLARYYRSLGVEAGDRVTLALPNGIAFYAVTHAVWKLGAVPVPISPALPERERTQLVDLIEPALVVGEATASPRGHRWVSADDEPGDGFSDAPLEPPPPSEMWKISTSGGSSGRPKLIVPAQTSELDLRAVSALHMQPGQRQLVVGPLYHASPFNWSILGSFLGQHLVVLPRFRPDAALEAIQEYDIGWVCLVPTMMHRMARLIDQDPDRYDLGSLEVVWHMAAPCPPWLKRRWIDLVGADTLFELYGSTEGIALTAISGREWLERPGSVGRTFQGEIKVVLADGRDAPPGVEGEVLMRRTEGARSYRYIGSEPTVHAGGWESLGDMGRMDADGYLYLTERQADMFLVGGVNVYPAETEAALLEHPAVLSCAVIGLPDEELGQRPHALVETAERLDPEALRAFLLDRLARVKVPRSFRFVDHPLRDDAGKVRRNALRRQEIEIIGAGSTTPSPAGKDLS